MRFQRLPEGMAADPAALQHVEAFRWWPTMGSVDGVKSMQPQGSINGLLLARDGSDIVVCPGDWIVSFADGSQECMSHLAFVAHYAPDAEPEP